MKESSMIYPGKQWLDTGGKPIQAHGGGFLADGGRTYWYGENKDGPTASEPRCGTRVDLIGVSCYVSDELVAWQNAGLALAARPDDPAHDLHPRNILERPKVLRCPATGRYVMWMHMDNFERDKAMVGVAVADSPTGPFHYLRSFRPHGCDSRDMTLFQDRDGSGWVIYSSEKNNTLHAGRLTADYLDTDGDYVRLMEGRRREAPAMFLFGERIFMISSGCSGWNPNPSEVAVAERVTGPWTVLGDPFAGDAAGNSFRSQSTGVLPLPGAPEGWFIYLGDRWEPADLGASSYVWLPMCVRGNTVSIEWRNSWNPAMYLEGK
jgi:hypothetical protein